MSNESCDSSQYDNKGKINAATVKDFSFYSILFLNVIIIYLFFFSFFKYGRARE